MELKSLFDDDGAVSPVIGVILMVAITVILAAVIASFVLGLGNQTQQTTPQASFAFDYEETGGNSLTITHDGGDSISSNEVYIRGSNLGGNTGKWVDLNGGGTPSDIQAGDSLKLSGVSSNYEVRVVFQALEGDNSATLGQDEGPEA